MCHLTVDENMIGFAQLEKKRKTSSDTFENPHGFFYRITLGVKSAPSFKVVKGVNFYLKSVCL
jgi:hypothetical protein